VQQCGRVRHLPEREVEPHERAHRVGVVDLVLHRHTGEVEPHLQQVHPQHRLDRHRPAAPLLVVVDRFDQPRPLLPRDHLVHHRQELLAAGGPPPLGVLGISETRLRTLHDSILPSQSHNQSVRHSPLRHKPRRRSTNNQRFLRPRPRRTMGKRRLRTAARPHSPVRTGALMGAAWLGRPERVQTSRRAFGPRRVRRRH
jgi:hypothetical protein